MSPPVGLYVGPVTRPWVEACPVVLEGSVSGDAGTCRTGQYARRPPGCAHAVTSPEVALALAIVSGGGIEPLT